MATLREIRRRITSVENIQQVTNAMYMVAAARFRRAQASILAARPYADKLDAILAHLVSQLEDPSHPLLEIREPKRVCIVSISADRGLCGTFNSNVIRETAQRTAHYREQEIDVTLICVGRRSRDFFRKRDYSIHAEHAGIFRTLAFSHATDIAQEVSDLYTHEQVDRVEVIHNNFQSAITQTVVVNQLLPILPKEPEGDEMFLEYLYEPEQDEIFEVLLPLYLNREVWTLLLDSSAAEQAARMTAMDNASKNAGELIEELIRQRNRARQTVITTEILEIVGGAAALEA